MTIPYQGKKTVCCYLSMDVLFVIAVCSVYKFYSRCIYERKSGARDILASEVVQLFCIVPAFLMLLGKDTGTIHGFFNSILLHKLMIYWQEISSLLSSTGSLCRTQDRN